MEASGVPTAAGLHHLQRLVNENALPGELVERLGKLNRLTLCGLPALNDEPTQFDRKLINWIQLGTRCSLIRPTVQQFFPNTVAS